MNKEEMAKAEKLLAEVQALFRESEAKAAEAPAGPSSTDALLMEIRDSLKK